MSSNTKAFEDKMKSAVEHLERELKTVRAGRANPGVLDKVTVDYYGSPTPIQQVASVAVSEARTLTITPWDRTLLRAISKAILASDVGINPIDDGQTIRLNFPAPNEERRKQLAKEVSKMGEEAKVAVRNVRRDAMDKAKAMMKEVKPDLVIGCGGYVSGPVVRCAAKKGIKTAIHEQNAFPGVTNKLLAPDVDIVFAASAPSWVPVTAPSSSPSAAVWAHAGSTRWWPTSAHGSRRKISLCSTSTPPDSTAWSCSKTLRRKRASPPARALR